MNTNTNFSVRETVVYHQVDNEESPLIGTPSSHRRNIKNGKKTHPGVLLNQQRVYSAITLADIFQKIVYTTITTSFLIYTIKILNYMSSMSLLLYFTFTLVSWLSAAIINLYSEFLFSRTTCITLGFLLYFLGASSLCGLTANMYVNPELFKYLSIIPFLLICIAEGLCKTTIGQFGHEQFKEKKLSEELHSFTKRLFWIGHTCALLVIGFLLGIIEFARYEIGIGLCCVCLAAGLLSFCTAWKNFEKPVAMKVKPLGLLYGIYRDARRSKKTFLKNQASGGIFHESLAGIEPPTNTLDFARLKYNGSYPDNMVVESKCFFKMVAIFLAFIPYWVCNAQGYSTFIYQALHLNTSIGYINIPVPWLALFNIVAVLFFVQLLESLVYPKLRNRGYSFPTTWRIIVGMVFAGLAMMFAGLLQLYLYKWASKGTNTNTTREYSTFNVTYNPHVHIFWTIPQFIFLGISEVLVGLTGLALACKICPNHFQKHVISFYYLVVAIGNGISLVAVTCGTWFPHGFYFKSYGMVVYFFALAALSLFGVLLFICVVSRQEYGTFGVHKQWRQKKSREICSESIL